MIALLLAAPLCFDVQARQVCVTAARPGLPLVVFLHGYGGDGAQDSLGLASRTDIAYATTTARPDASGNPEWRDDDHAFLAALIEQAARLAKADRRRVFLAGYSLGGFLATEYACTHGGIAGAISLAGSLFVPHAQCGSGVSLLQIHGDADTTVAIDGGVGKRTGRRYAAMRDVAAEFAKANVCGALEDALPIGPAQVRRAPCGVRIETWTVPGANHTTPLGPELRAAVAQFVAADFDDTLFAAAHPASPIPLERCTVVREHTFDLDMDGDGKPEHVEVRDCPDPTVEDYDAHGVRQILTIGRDFALDVGEAGISVETMERIDLGKRRTGLLVGVWQGGSGHFVAWGVIRVTKGHAHVVRMPDLDASGGRSVKRDESYTCHPWSLTVERGALLHAWHGVVKKKELQCREADNAVLLTLDASTDPIRILSRRREK